MVPSNRLANTQLQTELQVNRLADSHVPTVLDYAGALLCRAEDRQHFDNLAVVAEGHTEHPGQLVEAAAALALLRDRATARVVQVTMPLSSCRADAMMRLAG